MILDDDWSLVAVIEKIITVCNVSHVINARGFDYITLYKETSTASHDVKLNVSKNKTTTISKYVDIVQVLDICYIVILPTFGSRAV